MARKIHSEPSRTLGEYRLLPGLTTRECAPARVRLRTRLARRPAREGYVHLGIPLVSAAMQAVSGVDLACALAFEGGASVIFCSQSVDSQARMVRQIKASTLPQELDSAALGPDSALFAAAAVNTHDHRERVPALVEAGVDLVAIDASDGHSVYVQETLSFIRNRFPALPVIAGNVITAAGFRFLAEAGAHGVKVGMGSGSICTTQEQKGTGRGLATAVLEVARARDALREQTGRYLPLVADGGIRTAKDMVLALALGADTVMLGRLFAGVDEAPNPVQVHQGREVKAYWGEGSARARQWRRERYRQDSFEEGVEGYVPYAGALSEVLPGMLDRIRAAMSSCGAASIGELHQKAEVELVSALSMNEGGVHSIIRP